MHCERRHWHAARSLEFAVKTSIPPAVKSPSFVISFHPFWRQVSASNPSLKSVLPVEKSAMTCLILVVGERMIVSCHIT